MSLIVQKFGGTSLGTPERIRTIAKRIAAQHLSGTRLVIVVSAMGQTTDDLLALAHQVSDCPPHREMDMLLTAGERISMALLSMALSGEKVSAVSFTGSQTGIITDSNHRRARIRKILGDRLRLALSEEKVVIVAGFQGVSEKKEVTTLGRGGSDTTAVALASVLQAQRCEIYTDVDGVYSADPRIVPQARLWKQVPSDLMTELATLGAGVLHPRSVELACSRGVNLVVKNSLNPNGEGTVIVKRSEERDLEKYRIVGVTSNDDQFMIQASLVPQLASFSQFGQRVSQAHLPMVGLMYSGQELRFFSERECLLEWEKTLNELKETGILQSYCFFQDIVPVSVIGNYFCQDGMALHDLLDTLQRSGIQVYSAMMGSLSMTFGLKQNDVYQALQVLHSVCLEGRGEL